MQRNVIKQNHINSDGMLHKTLLPKVIDKMMEIDYGTIEKKIDEFVEHILDGKRFSWVI